MQTEPPLQLDQLKSKTINYWFSNWDHRLM